MINLLALIGWNPGDAQEIFTESELLERFTLEKIQKSGGAFNEEKLKWINKAHLKKLTQEEQLQFFTEALPDSTKKLPGYSIEISSKLAPIAFERISNQADIKTAAEAGEYDWAFTDPHYEKDLLQWKNDNSVSDALPETN